MDSLLAGPDEGSDTVYEPPDDIVIRAASEVFSPAPMPADQALSQGTRNQEGSVIPNQPEGPLTQEGSFSMGPNPPDLNVVSDGGQVHVHGIVNGNIYIHNHF